MEIILPTVGVVKRKRIKSKNKCGIKQVIKPVNTRARVFTPNAMQCAYIYAARALTKTKRLSLMAKQYLSTPKFVHHARLASAAGLVLLFGAFIMPIAPFYHSTVASPGTSNPSTTTLTMELGHENASLTILPSGTSGTFGTSTAAETAKFDIVTDNFTGYTLSLQGTNDTRQLVNSATSTVLDSIASVTTAATFDTDPYNNKWGFLPSKYNSTTNADYIPAPTTSAVATLDTTSTANNTAIDYSLGLGARVDINKPAGDYSNTYILAATGNAIHYTLNFDQNTTDTVSNMPLAQSASTTQTKIVVDSAVPQRAHYAFTGWCLGVTSTASGTDSCYTNDGTGQPSSTPGTVFQPGDDFGIDQTTANSTTVYAMWAMDTVTVELTAGTGIDTVAITGSGVKTGGTAGATSTAEVYYDGEITIEATPTTGYIFVNWTGDTTYTDNPKTISNVTTNLSLTANGGGAVNMQNLDPTSCTTNPTTVTDSRDGQRYIIQRLADGNCWMLDNLRLDISDASIKANLSSSNTNATDYSIDKLINGGGSGLYATDGVAAKTASSGSWTNTYTTPYIATANKDLDVTNFGNGSGKAGVYYNYCAASAGSYCTSTTAGNAVYDICPAGWRMPTGGPSGEYDGLLAAYSSDVSNTLAALSVNLSGYIVNNAFAHVNEYNWSWSSTGYGLTGYYSYILSVTSPTSFDGSYHQYGRAFGNTVRCVLDNSVTMQNINHNLINTLVPNVGDSTELRDIRDNNKYTVTKLSDGNIYMTENLRVTGIIRNEESNFDAASFNTCVNNLTSGNTYTQARCASGVDDNGDPTVWYNFAAASAGAVNTSSSTIDATQDICPAGWRMLNKDEATVATNDSSRYNLVGGGTYRDGALGGAGTDMSYSWTSTASSATSRYSIYKQAGGSSYVDDRANYTNRGYGEYIRCVLKPTMQGFSATNADSMSNGDTRSLIDVRDGKEYTVTKINGDVWMTQNLRFTGTELTPADSNVTTNTTMSYGDLTSGNSYDDARIHVSDNSSYGVWYNYAAASAGTITGASNTNEATSSICPKGWRLPTNSEFKTSSAFQNYFNPVLGGRWNGGEVNTSSGNGFYWSSTAANATNRYELQYLYSGHTLEIQNWERTFGFYVRCIYDNPAQSMQDFTNSDAAAMTAGETKSLIDIRDSQAYTVAKLADGNVWMIDNLNLGANTLTTNLDDKNSNTVGIVTATTFNSWKKSSATNTLTAGEFIPVDGQDSTSKSNYGTLYNYCATSAGTICSSSNDHDAVVDICPAGWRLPIGGTNGEYQTLYSNYGTYASMLNPVANGGAAFAQPGYFNTGTPSGDTAYQTSTNYDTLKMNALSFNAGVVHADNAGTRGLGFAIRCIYDGSRKTMQDFTNADAAAMATGESKMLVDSRDNEKYTVTKLADGNVWMTWNLRFTGTTLTPNDSNVGSNVTMSYGDLSEGNSYDQARIHTGVDNNGNSTVWYNYAAASAMSVTGSSDTTVQVYDICPKGWRLPTKEEQLGIVNYGTEYGMVSGGRWQNGASDGTTYGSWWASTLSTATDRWHMSNGSPMPTAGGNRYRGFYVRCIYNGPYQTMQNFSGADTAAMSTGETKVLVDSRDNQKYAVTKLSDGNVWMTRNLAIGCNGSTISSKNLTASDSNLVANWTTPDSSHSLTLGDDYTDPRLECSSKYGGWYNFSAATAENIVGSSSTVEPSQDICPAGWQIPTYTQGYNILSYTSQFNPINGGNYLSGSLDPRDRGIWWLSSSTGNVTPASQRRYLYANFGGNLGIGTDGNRSLGLYIRCIKKNITSISQLSTMQQFNGLSSTEKTNVLNSMTANTAYSLTDSRDEQVYQVKKINGTVWMTRNLAIGCNGTGSTYGSAPSAKTLTPADTDTASNFTTSTNSWEYSYTNPAQTCSDTYGAWYNYVSATAGTITGQTNTNDAQYSICPAGWRLPNTTEISDITSYSSAFAPTTGGRYYIDNFVSGTDNGFGYTTYGIYWASTSYSSTGRWWLGNNNGSLYTNNGDYGPIDAGFYIRCVAK